MLFTIPVALLLTASVAIAIPASVTPTTSTGKLTSVTPTTTTAPKTISTVTPTTTTITSATTPASPPPPVCARGYTVAVGDTCNAISNAQHSSTFQLAFVNSFIDAACDNLVPGEQLCLGIVGQDCTSTHTVVQNDNCEAIAAAAGITFATLLANNPNVNDGCSNIGIGEVLCTGSTIINYTEHF